MNNNDDYQRFLDFAEGRDDRLPYIKDYEIYQAMKQQVKIQSMNYYLLGKGHKNNTLTYRLRNKAHINLYNSLKSVALLSVSSVIAKE